MSNHYSATSNAGLRRFHGFRSSVGWLFFAVVAGACGKSNEGALFSSTGGASAGQSGNAGQPPSGGNMAQSGGSSSQGSGDAGATAGGEDTTGGGTAGSGSGQGGATAGGGGKAGSGGNAGSSTSGSGGGPPACSKKSDCASGFDCCSERCVNTANNPLHCGACGVECSGDEPFCQGSCVPRPCGTTCGDDQTCCGGACCTTGQLCCLRQVGATQPFCTAPEHGTCPPGIPGSDCAAPNTPIATPSGERAIAELQPGDIVYSIHRSAIVAVPILRVHRTPVHGHRVMRVTLANRRVLEISAGHPTLDGRDFGALAAGDRLDATPIAQVEVVPYAEPFTYDILPDSDSGAYFAAGAAIGSTLSGPAPARPAR